MRPHTIVVGMLFTVVCCTTPDTKARIADTAHRPADSGSVVATADRIGVTEGLQNPESVRYDSTLDVFFVSNIKGGPSDKDDDASISIVDAATRQLKGSLVVSKKNGVELNAPKGLALVGDTLWVADVDFLRGFNKRTGAVVANIDLRPLHAVFLNDVCVGPDGALYITDSGQMGKSPFGQVIRVAGRSASVFSSGDSLKNPNGITYDVTNKRFIVVQLGGTDIQSIPVGGGAPTHVASGKGQFDGVEMLATGDMLVTSWADSSVYEYSGTSGKRLFGNVPSPADIGVDTKRKVLAVPELQMNKIEYFQLP